MLKEAKKALRVTIDHFDSEIAHLLMAGANDLEIAGVTLPGTVTFTIGTDDAVVDTSTLTDHLAMRAIIQLGGRSYSTTQSTKYYIFYFQT